MVVGRVSSWLPQYLIRVQPYSMGPLLGYEWPDMLMPPAGTCVWLDNVALSAATMWMAPAPVRREARRLGLPMPRLRVPGLAEALERAGIKTWQGPKVHQPEPSALLVLGAAVEELMEEAKDG